MNLPASTDRRRPVAELVPGDRIPTTLCGYLTVFRTPWTDPCDGRPDLDRVYVDVRVEDPRGPWDAAELPAATGAVDMMFLGLVPTLRYRLAFTPDATVDLADPFPTVQPDPAEIQADVDAWWVAGEAERSADRLLYGVVDSTAVETGREPS